MDAAISYMPYKSWQDPSRIHIQFLQSIDINPGRILPKFRWVKQKLDYDSERSESFSGN